MLFIQNHHGLFVVALKSSNALDLTRLLDPTVPLVCLVGHSPDERVKWSAVEMPLAINAPAHRFRIRSLSFDLEMPTPEFLSSVQDLKSHGMHLLQLDRSLPPNI